MCFVRRRKREAAAKREVQTEKTEERQRQRQAAFVPPKVRGHTSATPQMSTARQAWAHKSSAHMQSLQLMQQLR